MTANTTTHPLDVTWSDEFALPGFDGTVLSLLPDSGRMLMGGSFKRVGSLEADHVVWWDGAALTALPSNPAARLPDIRTMIRWNGHLVVGGFQVATCAPAVCLWNGSQWQSLRDPFQLTTSLAVYRGDLIATGSGNSLANCSYAGPVARWNGSAWVSVVANSHLSSTSTLAVMGDSLYIAGRQSAGYSITGIHVWNGTAMTVPGAGLQTATGSAEVNSLLVHEGRLYAAGDFTRTGAALLGSTIAVFDGATWSPVGHAAGTAGQLAVWNGALVANISSGGLVRTHQLVAGEWEPIPSLVVPSALTALASLGSRLVVGQTTTSALQPRAYDGLTTEDIQHDAWTAGMRGMIGSGQSLAVWNDQLVVAAPSAVGSGGQYAIQPELAAWDGAQWQSLPAGPSMFASKVLVDSTGALLCGGWLSPNGLVRRWDGVQWSTLGGAFNYPVSDLQFADGSLYALGQFFGGDVYSVARLDGAAWVAPSGCGLATYYFEPEDLAAANGRLVVAGGPVELYCDGSTEASDVSAFFHDASSGWTYPWPQSPFPFYTPYWHTAAEFEGRAVFGGDEPEICRSWDGAAWHDLSAGAGQLDVLQALQGRLFGAGKFLDADSTTWVYGVGEWTGSRWKLLGSGMNGPVHTLAEFDGDLYAAGDFSWANGKLSFGIARWMGLTRLDAPAGVAASLRLSPPRPNPANGAQRFAFTLPAASHVRLVIHDVAGRRVATLLDEARPAGTHGAAWDGRDASGASVAPGTYFARLRTDTGEARTTVLRVR